MSASALAAALAERQKRAIGYQPPRRDDDE